MATQRLQNYLRAYRKKSGLTQQELAFLLGCKSRSRISRYEKRRRLPPLRTAIACEVALGIPVSSLFAGMRDEAERDIRKREKELRSRLQHAVPSRCRS